MARKDQKDRDAACPPCFAIPGEGRGTPPCGLFKDYITPDEEHALAMIRELRERAATVKARMKELEEELDRDIMERDEALLSPGQRARRKQQASLYAEWKKCSGRLERLRAERRRWNEKRKEANRVKMILLGHKD